MRRAPILCAAVPLLMAGAASAVTHRVPSDYSTIQAGLDASVAGDSVLVAPGTYTDYEQRLIFSVLQNACAFLVDGVVLLSESGPAVTTIDMMRPTGLSQPNVMYGSMLTSGQTVVEGFTITGGPDGREGIFVVDSEKVTFRNCIIRDMNGVGTTAA